MTQQSLKTIGILSIALLTSCLTGVSIGLTQIADHTDVDTLDMIEVPGTAVVRTPRTLEFPVPDLTSFHPILTVDPVFRVPDSPIIDRARPRPSPALDPIGQMRGIRTPVKPIKAQRPPYPRFAREQGWEGITILRISIESDGSVTSAKTQKSSGYPILDESAVQTVTQWIFAPAKNGEFDVASTVDLPIRFDLDQPN
ncbi:energy transducer TonB [Nitrospira sp. M1]